MYANVYMCHCISNQNKIFGRCNKFYIETDIQSRFYFIFIYTDLQVNVQSIKYYDIFKST